MLVFPCCPFSGKIAKSESLKNFSKKSLRFYFRAVDLQHLPTSPVDALVGILRMRREIWLDDPLATFPTGNGAPSSPAKAGKIY